MKDGVPKFSKVRRKQVDVNSSLKINLIYAEKSIASVFSKTYYATSEAHGYGTREP